jgi:hypothetical protein
VRGRERKTYEPALAGALYSCGRGVELLLERVEGVEGLIDRALEGTICVDPSDIFYITSSKRQNRTLEHSRQRHDPQPRRG